MIPSMLKMILVSGMCATGVFAQFHANDGPGRGAAPDPATMIAHRISFLTTQLSLTASQVTQATTIFTNELAAETPLRAGISTDRTSLAAAIKSGNTSNIESLSTHIGFLEGQLTALNANAQAAFYALLTADQKTKYDAEGHGGGGFGGGGFGGRRAGRQP